MTLHKLDDMTWPDEHVAWQSVIAGWPEMSVPFDTHVFIFHTIEQLQAACGDRQANAHSSTWRTPDSAGVGALVMLTAEHLELAVIAHESTHIALFHHRNILDRGDRTGARRWLDQHPETIAEMVGNLTALIWYGIPTREELP